MGATIIPIQIERCPEAKGRFRLCRCWRSLAKSNKSFVMYTDEAHKQNEKKANNSKTPSWKWMIWCAAKRGTKSNVFFNHWCTRNARPHKWRRSTNAPSRSTTKGWFIDSSPCASLPKSTMLPSNDKTNHQPPLPFPEGCPTTIISAILAKSLRYTS